MIIEVNDIMACIECYADNIGVIFTNENTYNAALKMLLSEDQIKRVRGKSGYFDISDEKYKEYKANLFKTIKDES